jgi:hypothetical protein
MSDRMRANYALLDFREHLGSDPDALDVPWAEFVGEESSTREFEVPTAAAADPYVELQGYDVASYGHEIRVNDRSVPGFDVPPSNGWQYWMDSLAGIDLQAGTNTLAIHRDVDSADEFVVGSVVVHWREPVE